MVTPWGQIQWHFHGADIIIHIFNMVLDYTMAGRAFVVAKEVFCHNNHVNFTLWV